MKKLLLPLILFSSISYGADCSKHPIFCQIKKNQPSIKKEYDMKLSNVIYKAAKKHKISAKIYTAILRQESNYSLSAKGCHKGLMEVKNPELQGVAFVEVKICNDFGMSQINYRTAKRYGLDNAKLLTDLEYSIMAGAKVLADFKKYGKKDKDWWTRYNCGTRSSTKRDTCQIYKSLVSRYL